MTYYPDLGTRTMIASAPYIRAVGWLSSAHPFTTGSVSVDFSSKLGDMCARWIAAINSLGFCVVMGVHTCEMCGSFNAGGNLGVPGDGVLYVAPEMIAHYVSAHAYLPPREFVQAVNVSPLPGTEEYERAVRAIMCQAG